MTWGALLRFGVLATAGGASGVATNDDCIEELDGNVDMLCFTVDFGGWGGGGGMECCCDCDWWEKDEFVPKDPKLASLDGPLVALRGGFPRCCRRRCAGVKECCDGKGSMSKAVDPPPEALSVSKEPNPLPLLLLAVLDFFWNRCCICNCREGAAVAGGAEAKKSS